MIVEFDAWFRLFFPFHTDVLGNWSHENAPSECKKMFNFHVVINFSGKKKLVIYLNKYVIVVVRHEMISTAEMSSRACACAIGQSRQIDWLSRTQCFARQIYWSYWKEPIAIFSLPSVFFCPKRSTKFDFECAKIFVRRHLLFIFQLLFSCKMYSCVSQFSIAFVRSTVGCREIFIVVRRVRAERARLK